MVESMTEAGQRDRALGRRKPTSQPRSHLRAPVLAQHPTKVSTCLTLPLASTKSSSSESSSHHKGATSSPCPPRKLFPDRHSFPSFERSCSGTPSALSSSHCWGDRGAGLLRPALHAAPRAEQAPHGLCPSEACPGTDAAPSLQTGERTWPGSPCLVILTGGRSAGPRRPQGQDPGAPEKVTQRIAFLSR